MRILFALCILMLFACKSNKESDMTSDAAVPESLQGLYQEVLDIHDEVMPKMGDITALQEKMVVRLDTLRAQDPIDSDLLREANNVLGQLNKSESAMWDWMHGFSALDTIAVDRKEAFLQTNKSTATEMRDLILNSLKEAEAYLNR